MLAHRKNVYVLSTYTCPNSCAMVYAELIPLSSTIEQLLYGSHIVPNSAKPEKINNMLFRDHWKTTLLLSYIDKTIHKVNFINS